MKAKQKKKQEDLDPIGTLALSHSSDIHTRVNGKQVRQITEARSSASAISGLHRLGKKLASTREELFKATPLCNGFCKISYTSPTARTLINYLQHDFNKLRSQYPHHIQSPIFEAFECVARRIPLPTGDIFKTHRAPSEATDILRRLNVTARVLKSRLKSQRVKSGYSNFRRNAQARFHETLNYLHCCMTKRSNQTIIRVDLHFDDEEPLSPDRWTQNLPNLIEGVRSKRQRFHAYLNSRFKDALIGYLTKVEIGAKRGFHIHALIILDAAQHQQDVNLTTEIGEEWKRNINSQGGDYYNCNAAKHIYKYKAIGRVNTNDPDVVIGLRLIAAYFSLSELFVQADLPKSFRTFCRMQPPKPGNNRGGRPSAYKPSIDIRNVQMKDITGNIAFI